MPENLPMLESVLAQLPRFVVNLVHLVQFMNCFLARIYTSHKLPVSQNWDVLMYSRSLTSVISFIELINESEYSLGPMISAVLPSLVLSFLSNKLYLFSPTLLSYFVDFPKHSFSQMDFFESILSLLGVSSRIRPRPIALESSALSKLPLELILHIACFLPPDSASSFSLCCRPIYFTLGNQYLKALEENEQLDRYNFLTLLERDLPNHISCCYCKKLHAINKAHQHLYSNRYYLGTGRYLSCWTADFDLWACVYIHYDFSSTIFQMTMKRHRQGLDCSKLLNLLSYKTKTRFRHGYVEQCTALAKIVDGSLLVRVQRIFMIQTTQLTPVPWHSDFAICPHFEFISMESFDRYSNTIQIAQWDEPKGHQNWEGIIQCKHCLTEFRIDFKNIGGRGNAMFVTRWKNLGEGRSPLDYKWQSHVDWHKGRHWLPVEFDRGSICAAFEQKEHFKFEFDSLLNAQNKKELYRNSPSWWPEDI